MSMSMDEELICIKHLFKKWILPTRAFKKFYEWSIIFKDQLTEKKQKKLQFEDTETILNVRKNRKLI